MNVIGKRETLEQFGRHVSSGKLAFFQNAGIEFVLGKRAGPYLWDLEGEKRLIDCHCNGGVFNLGHRNREILETIEQSLGSLDIGNHHLISVHRTRLATELASLTPSALQYTVFGVSGGEAVDLAIKVARAFTRRSKIVSVRGGYHGHTGLALAAGDEKYRTHFRASLPDFQQVPYNDLEQLTTAADSETAALILETIPATSGMPLPHPGYLPAVKELCRRNGSLLILDEIQAGLGRTGRLWAFENYGVEPDILVLGKGLSGGIYPISATCFSALCESVFHEDPFVHVSTFGGAELGCAVALKVLEITSSPSFLSHVREMAALFNRGFVDLADKFPGILIGLRQMGLMMGIEFSSRALGPMFTKCAYDNGVLSVYANNDPSVCQLLPPLTLDEELAEEILERISGALQTISALVEQRGGPS